MSEFLVSESYAYDTVSNEFYNKGILDLFKRDSIAYYEERSDNFPLRSGNRQEEAQKLNSDQIRMLEEIQEIFSRNNTDYKIIVCPTYNQREFNHRDLFLIQSIFGNENVFDFTGINRFTEDKAYYYDEFHFKKYLGKELLDSVYSSSEMR